MKNCLHFITVFFVAILLMAFTSVKQKEKKLIGHWATKNYMGYYDDGSPGVGDTITFYKMKFSGRLYHWGGGITSGIEFKPDSQFVQYKNVACSDESDIRIANSERYLIHDDSIVEVTSSLRNFRFKILFVDSKKLTVRILGK